MLSKKQRIDKVSFKKFFSATKFFQSKNFSVKIGNHAINDKTKRRFSVIVSKKISNKAVIRNKIRRVFYEILHDLLSKNLIFEGIFFFFPKKSSMDKKFKELKEETISFFECLGSKNK